MNKLTILVATEDEKKSLIPEEYNGVDKENIIFILDGFDEIAIEYRRKFIINL